MFLTREFRDPGGEDQVPVDPAVRVKGRFARRLSDEFGLVLITERYPLPGERVRREL